MGEDARKYRFCTGRPGGRGTQIVLSLKTGYYTCYNKTEKEKNE